MRVPIENGSGFINQVSDFIKLPAALGLRSNNFYGTGLTDLELACCGFFISAKNMVHIRAFA